MKPLLRAAPWIVLSLAMVVFAPPLRAHSTSDSYLSLDVEGDAVDIRWDIALRDLDPVLGLDADLDGTLTWGEVKARADAIEGLALGHLALATGSERCVLHPTDGLIDRHADGTYYVLLARATCPGVVARLQVAYSLFFATDTTHRGLVRLRAGSDVRTAVFAPETSTQQFAFGATAAAPLGSRLAFAAFVTNGVRHILEGYDHLLFLLSLLLPAVLLRREATWRPAPSMRPVASDVLRTVTAFTAAHSITFMLAAYGVVDLPSRLVESAIAASVVVVALNNVVAVVESRRWIAAFLFGLVHGFGFASLLNGLELPPGAVRALPVLGFNLGVELGQVAVVALVLPLLYALRGTLFYRRAVLVGGSFLIAAIGATWFLQRALDVSWPRFAAS